MKLARNVSFAILLLGAVLCLHGVAHSAPAQGEDANRKVVRIAYQESDRLMMVDANNEPDSGYVFDYIQTIGTYSGWRVQYIPCNSFSECVTKLLSGEVELAYDISYTVVMAKDGKEALDILNSSDTPCYLVLTDMWMPVMDGEGLVRAVREDRKFTSLQVHVVTADTEMQGKYNKQGFDGIILKPVTMEKLKGIIG